MPAPSHAQTLLSINSTWRESKLKYICTHCSHQGHVSELLTVDEERTLWCPKCRTANMG
jgi:DNA-directed RNA polymerase subunit RPC12/RpoP